MHSPRNIFTIRVNENPASASDTQNALISISFSGSSAAFPGKALLCHTRYNFLASDMLLIWGKGKICPFNTKAGEKSYTVFCIC